MIDIATINRMDRDQFVATFGGLFGHSPWIATRAWDRHPFASLEAMHAAMVAVAREASPADQLVLLRAHPDLAGKAARAGTMTDSSKEEQGGAGLDSLSESEFARFEALNAAYVEKFGFPFIIAVRGLDKHGILAAFETRLAHDAATELDAALGQIARITRMRLDRMSV